MKRNKNNSWEEFEKRLGQKRGKKTAASSAPSDILVQRMSTTPSGRLKKFEPLDTRDFVPFPHDELTIENVREACEIFYKAPKGSCDVLASDRGPSCSKSEQIKGKKVLLVRFLEQTSQDQLTQSLPATTDKKSDTGRRDVMIPPSSIFPKSVSIGDLLKAGKLVRPSKPTRLELESFSVQDRRWESVCSVDLQVEDEKFASGAFRDAFLAKSCQAVPGLPNKWVIKKYSQESVQTISNVLGIGVEDHTRKQVQMHSVARYIAQKFASKIPPEFGDTFEYGKVFYSTLNNLPVTVEEYIAGEFSKYINNNGKCIKCPNSEHAEVYDKAQTFAHFSYVFTDKRLIVLDLQGSMFKLYDPEIATEEMADIDDPTDPAFETYFCAGNLSHLSINDFFANHVCNKYCKLAGLEAN